MEETQQSDSDTAVRHGSPMFGPENVDFLGLPLSWPFSSSEQSDRQGVIGEYADFQESTETSFAYHDEKGLIISRPTDSAAEVGTSKGSTKPNQPNQELHTLVYQPAKTRNGSVLQSAQAVGNRPSFPTSRNETTFEPQLPFLLSDSLSSDQDSTSIPSVGREPGPEHPTPSVITGSLGQTTGASVFTQGKTQEETVQVKEPRDGLFDVTDNLHTVSMAEETGKSPSFN